MIYYFDNAAASRPMPEVLEFYLHAMQEDFANQEAIHLLGYDLRRKLDEAAKELCMALLGSTDDLQVIWAGSATECFRIVAAYLAEKQVISSELEHPALIANFKQHTKLKLLPVDRSGSIGLPEPAGTPDAVIFHHVQSETGIIQDLSALFSAYPRALHLTDAVQSAGKLPLCQSADLHIISGVKFGAPGGAAVIWKKSAGRLQKLASFASEMRSRDHLLSRVNVPLCRTLAFAATLRARRQEAEFERISGLNLRLRQHLSEVGISPLLPGNASVSPYILNFFLPGIQAAVVVRALSEHGIYCASGSACAAEAGGPSPALLALGKSKKDAFSGLRISFDGSTTENDVDFLASRLKMVLKNY